MSILSFTKLIFPLLFWLFLIIGFDPLGTAVITVLSAVIHEFGHIGAIYLIHGKIVLPLARMRGFSLSKNRLSSYKEEMLIALSGPLINLLIFILCLPFYSMADGYISLIAVINVMTFVSNMLPLRGYDGYLVLYNLIATKRDAQSAELTMRPISFAFSTVLVFFSLFLILKIGEGYWIFAVFFAVLLEEIFKRGN